MLELASNNVTGELPAFHNPNLSLLNFRRTNVSVSGASSGFWNSSSPVLLLELSDTRLSGALPESLAFGGTLQVLHAENTSLQGTLPFSWLGPNKTLNSVMFGGQAVWRDSIANAAWRTEFCLNESIYEGDVAARSAAVIGGIDARLTQNGSQGTVVNVDGRVAALLAWAMECPEPTSAICHSVTHTPSVTYTPSVTSTPASGRRTKVVACLWGTFLVLVACVFGVFFSMRLLGQGASKSASLTPEGKGRLQCCHSLSNRPQCPELISKIGRRLFGLLGLGVYCAALGTDIQIIVDVWGLWRVYALLAILLGHQVYRGLVVSLYLMHAGMEARSGLSLEDKGVDASNVDRAQWALPRIILAVVLSPLATLFTLLLDAWSFFGVFGLASLPLLTVESYSEMRTVLMAAVQSSCSALIATAIYSVGVDGNGLSDSLYIRSMVFSCASMLLGLCSLLHVSHSRGRQLLRTFFLLATGGLLRPADPAATLTGCLSAMWTWLRAHVGCFCGLDPKTEEENKVVKDTKDPDQGYFQM
jgi:hypothetical protein